MVIGLNLMFNFNKSWLNPNFSRGKKLLHVFLNILYIIIRLLSENLSCVAFKISFLWIPQHGIYAVASFAEM